MRGRFSVSYVIIRKKYDVAVISNVLKWLSGSQSTISVEYSLQNIRTTVYKKLTIRNIRQFLICTYIESFTPQLLRTRQ